MKQHLFAGTLFAVLVLLFLITISGSAIADACTESCDNTNISCGGSCDSYFTPQGSITSGQKTFCAENGGASNVSSLESCEASALSTKQSCYASCESSSGDEQQYSLCTSTCEANYSNTLWQDCHSPFLEGCKTLCKGTCSSQNSSCNESCGAGTGDGDAGCGDADVIPGNDGGPFEIPDDIPTNTSPCESDPELKVYEINGYDGVAADGKAEITFKIEPIRDIKNFSFDLVGPIRGKVTKTETTITYRPDEADETKNFLVPDNFTVVVDYIDTCDDARTKIAAFTVEQPAVIMLHGILSEGSVYAQMEAHLQSLGFQTKAISYPNRQAIEASAAVLATETQKYLNEIRGGNFYNFKKISAEKLDDVAHSMGGLVSREYSTTELYQDDIRKLITIGTPHRGSVLSSRISTGINFVLGPLIGNIVQYIGSVAAGQLEVGSSFLNNLNARGLNTNIRHFTVSGITWATININTNSIDMLGDGIVHLSSSTLPGVPNFCTYDTHSSGMSENWSGTNISNTTGLLESPEVFGIVTDLILENDTAMGMPCGIPANATNIDYLDKAWSKIKGVFKSPGNLHAYDAEGNHTGRTENGIEIGIPGSNYLEGISEGKKVQIIELLGKEGTNFVVDGNGEGHYTFEIYAVETDGTATLKSFTGIITPETRLSIAPLKDVMLNVDTGKDGTIDETITGITESYDADGKKIEGQSSGSSFTIANDFVILVIAICILIVILIVLAAILLGMVVALGTVGGVDISPARKSLENLLKRLGLQDTVKKYLPSGLLKKK